MATYRRLARRCGLTPLGIIGEKKPQNIIPEYAAFPTLLSAVRGFRRPLSLWALVAFLEHYQRHPKLSGRALLHRTALRFAISARQRWCAISALSITPRPLRVSRHWVCRLRCLISCGVPPVGVKGVAGLYCIRNALPFGGRANPLASHAAKIDTSVHCFNKKQKIFFRHPPCARYRHNPRYIQTMCNNLAKH